MIGIIGALFRRWWGGWFSPPHWVKLPIGFILPALLAYRGGLNPWVALIVGVWSGLAFLNTFHGEGMNMGRNYPDGPSLPMCFLIMGGSYSVYFLGMACSLFVYTHSLSSFLVLPAGAFIPCGYWFAHWIWEKAALSPFGEYPCKNVFIDGPCAIGELSLGAIVFVASDLIGRVV